MQTPPLLAQTTREKWGTPIPFRAARFASFGTKARGRERIGEDLAGVDDGVVALAVAVGLGDTEAESVGLEGEGEFGEFAAALGDELAVTGGVGCGGGSGVEIGAEVFLVTLRGFKDIPARVNFPTLFRTQRERRMGHPSLGISLDSLITFILSWFFRVILGEA